LETNWDSGDGQAIYKSKYTCNTERRKTRREAGKMLVLKELNFNFFFYCHLSFAIGTTATNTAVPYPVPVTHFFLTC
jgi:hypothetical protein